mgnify:FL=1
MIKSTIGNSNFWLGLCVVGLVFMMLYPTTEYNVNCPMAATDPDGNESCTGFKSMLWDLISIMSLGLGGDGSALSDNVDEQHRNVVPLMTVTIIILFYQKRKA